MIWVYYADTSSLNDDARYQSIYAGLSAHRREKADRLRLRNDKNLCIGAGFLLNKGLQAFGLSESEREYGENRNGKPFFPDLPDLHFNLSHSGTIAMAALSDHEIGCDIERIRKIELAVAKRFFASREYENLQEQPSVEAQMNLFFRLWTLKESYLKATGYGLAYPMHDFEICFTDNGVAPVQGPDDKQYYFREIPSFDGYQSALCSAEEEPQVSSSILTIA